MNYNDLTRHHFETARHAGVLGGQAHRGAAGRREHGIWVQFDVETSPPSGGADGVVVTVRFLAYGCPHVIAVADWVAENAVGLAAAPVLPESVAALRHRFDAPVEKLGRLLIVEDAWMAAIASPYPIAAA